MTQISVRRKGKVIKVREPTVEDLIALMSDQYETERSNIIEDLEASGASGSERLAALQEHRKTRGLTGNLMRSAFSLEGAVKIIRWVAEGKTADELLQGTPEETVRLALQLLGFEDDDEQSQESSTEGKVPEAAAE